METYNRIFCRKCQHARLVEEYYANDNTCKICRRDEQRRRNRERQLLATLRRKATIAQREAERREKYKSKNWMLEKEGRAFNKIITSFFGTSWNNTYYG